MAGNLRTKAGVTDLVLLEENQMSDDGISELLNQHFNAGEIYTYIGQVLVSVNPFRDIPNLYSQGTLNKYKGKNQIQNLPHVYAVAERAYRKMIQDLGRECVIISGESGAGKTEASKKIMEYIAAVSSKAKAVQRVKEQLLESNPLLEAFGNAKTIRNNNSSRFGKYMEIQFDVANPSGGNISVYLLEKSRVIERQETERSFHIFYQLCAGCTQQERKDLCLDSAENYTFLAKSNCFTVDGINDVAEFADTRKAMSTIGLDAASQKEIFKLLSAILTLGNLDFVKQGAKCAIENQDWAGVVAFLLGVDTNQLNEDLTSRTIKSATETIRTPMSVAEAQYARDSLAKGIYGRLFLWLVEAANKSIHSDYFSNTIGVLDIYGFEIFGVNGFEQLCINFVNEKLHQLFIELTLKAEQNEYAQEGIEWVMIKYHDNLPVCKLIEDRGKIFSLLDEESIFPRGNDVSLHDKLSSQLREKEFTSGGKFGQGGDFSIKHYAGQVTYSTCGFLDKNKDLLFPNLIQLCNTGSGLLQALFLADAKIDTKKRPVTSCVQFKSQVAHLMGTLGSCRQHYVRCIKPNHDKRPNFYDPALCKLQIQYLGLLENTKVRRAGYAYRIPYEKFLSQYKACSKRHIKVTENPLQATESLLKELGFNDYKLGKTKLFIRSAKSLFAMEDKRAAFLAQAATLCPPTDQLIYADKVVAYDSTKAKNDLIFCITAQHCFIFQGKKAIHSVEIGDLDGVSVGDRVDGFLVCHCVKKFPPKGNAPPPEPKRWDILVENVYKAELFNVVEVLRTSGVVVDVRRTDVIPQSTDPNFVPPVGTVNKSGKCSIM